MLPGCEASPKHGDLREPAVAGAALSMAHVAQARGPDKRLCAIAGVV